MRKILSIAVIFALAFTLAVPSFATSVIDPPADPDECTLMENMIYLVEDCGPRLRGSANEFKAAEYVNDKFIEYGYENVFWNKNVVMSGASNAGVLTFSDGGPDIFGNALPNTNAFTLPKAPIVDLGLHTAWEIPSDVAGDFIGVVRFFRAAPAAATVNAVIAEAAGRTDVNLVGLLLTRVGDLFPSRNSLLAPAVPSGTYTVPLFALPDYFADKAIERSDDFVKGTRESWTLSTAVTATKPATSGVTDAIIVVTGHLDSVLASPGANDNATACAQVLEMAKRFVDVDTGNIELRFAVLGSEEGGGMAGANSVANLIVSQGNVPIAINLNHDMTAPKQRINHGYFAPNPPANTVRLNALSIDTWMGRPWASEASTPLALNIASYLFTNHAALVDWNTAATEIVNVRIFKEGASDHTRFGAVGMYNGSMIFVHDESDDIEYGYHSSMDNLDENYCYDTHVVSAAITQKAIEKAIEYELSMKAKFEIVDTGASASKVDLVLANAEQLFNIHHKVVVNVDGINYEFVKGGPDKFEIAKADDYDVGSVFNYGTTAAPARRIIATASAVGIADNRWPVRNALYENFDTKLLVEATVVDARPSVIARVDAAPTTHVKDAVEYTLSIKEAVDVLAVDAEFVVDGAMLAASSFETFNGFSVLEAIKWTDNGDGTWTGAVRFGYTPEAGENGFSTDPYADIAKFVFTSQGVLGEATLELTKLDITGYNADIDTVVFFNVIIEEGTGTTIIGNKYDLSKDGKVDLIDLGIMLLYVGYNSTDPEWDTLIKVYDKNGVGITPKDCDINFDDEVDMADVIELMANFD